MRRLEGTLLALSAAASTVVALGGLAPLAINIKLVALVGQVLAFLQIPVEGARWQLYPAYAVGMLNVGALAAASFGPGELPRAASIAIPAGGLLLLAAAATLALVLPVLGPALYPALGPHRVGSRYVCVEGAGAGAKDAEAAGERDLSGLLFYPAATAAPGAAPDSSPYMPDGTFLSDAVARFARMPAFIFSHMRLFRMPTATDAPLTPPQGPGGRLPVVLLLHGLGGFRVCYSALAARLASDGFLVLAIDHSDGSAAAVRYASGRVRPYAVPAEPQETHEELWHAHRARQLRERVEDVREALRFLVRLDGPDGPLPEFRGRLDVGRAAVVGHSFGAVTALLACHALHPAFRAGVGLDVWAYPAWGKEPLLQRDGPLVPFALVDSERWPYEPNEARTAALFAPAPAGSLRARLRGAGHQSFSDFGLFAGAVLRRMGQVGEAGPQACLGATAALTAAFLRRHVLQAPGPEPLLDGPPEALPPELLITARA